MWELPFNYHSPKRDLTTGLYWKFPTSENVYEEAQIKSVWKGR